MNIDILSILNSASILYGLLLITIILLYLAFKK